MKKINSLIILGIITLLVTTSCTPAEPEPQEVNPALQSLAECLTESGAKLYGAYWCPHCIEQKEIFGASKDSLPYVECTEEQETCTNAGITGYPTWIFADGTAATGAQTPETLANLAGCTYEG